ncbi:hypothetical protein [Leptospira levettii]|uniref:hypothetical protein n=1 Tax=Leptospira levettii TaxID=2023178 RepID=UPI000C2AE305|nr:hypothetical protein [Leptospira levettii]PJZ87425.1 hypothetical protein CH368_16915 [Leptospira levettii]
MVNINVGSAVRLKGGHTIMTVTKITGVTCTVTWTVEDNKINNFAFELDSLDVVPDSEVKEDRRRINKRENAKVGLSVADQINKIGSPIVALISILAIVYQTYRLKDLEDRIDNLVNSIKSNTSQLKEDLIPKTPK